MVRAAALAPMDAYKLKAGKTAEVYFRKLPDPADHPVFALSPGTFARLEPVGRRTSPRRLFSGQSRLAEGSQPGTQLRPLASALNSTPGRPAKPSGTSPLRGTGLMSSTAQYFRHHLT